MKNDPEIQIVERAMVALAGLALALVCYVALILDAGGAG